MNTQTIMNQYTDPETDAAAPSADAKSNLRPILIGAVIALAAGIAAWQYGSTPDEAALPAPAAEQPSPLLSGTLGGTPAATGMSSAPAAGKAPQVPGLEVMADRLAKRLEKDAGDGEGWALLARTYLELGNLAQAEAAQTQALRLRPNDTRMKADYDAAKAVLTKSIPAATP